MPLVQDQSLDLLISSPARYHCTTDARPLNITNIITTSQLYYTKNVHLPHIVISSALSHQVVDIDRILLTNPMDAVLSLDQHLEHRHAMVLCLRLIMFFMSYSQ